MAAEREARLIEKYRGRIAGLVGFPAMDFIGLAWAGSSDPGESPYERYIDALYRRSAIPTGFHDVAVRTWLREPLARREFSVEPYLATHVHDFMFERKGGEFDFDYGVSEIAEALGEAGRQPGTVAVRDIVGAQHTHESVVTVVGYARYLSPSPEIIVGLTDIPRVRG
ncbi:hypothetical protein [Agromyces aerolatus]|uniref:hypothetical protein n=1 Tax=Agromyces sp. LY-1074 TaxID=3074080 RepID=UPI0028668609|nr:MULTISPECIES: hypothetical protein [unclassified Agromyces]MDR5700306.1 hypothetical protein [Agromyces sp. LY-1074]MDR5706716.1 hypothetical protein [Agromyces sp. LY-1358]